MLPVWLTVFFGAIFMAYVAVDTPKKESSIVVLKADVSATNFIAYRRAVQRYLDANPGVTGTIADASLGAYWLPGYIRDAKWTNVVSGGALYVYSTSADTVPNTLEAIKSKSPENPLLGTKAASGRLTSYNGFDTGITLPAGIPNNAIVMMGR